MLTRSTDRKTAAAATPNGKGVKVANAFGLPAGKAFSCPGATAICEKVCYAGRLEKQYKAFMAVMLSNFDALKACGDDINAMVDLIHPMIQDFVSECDKKNVEKYFRIHHDGDFYSYAYARAWAIIADRFPEVTFWVYTRSFIPGANVIPAIAGRDNLAVYLSVDAENAKHAKTIVADYPGINVAALADTFEDAKSAILDIRGENAPGAKCPELTKQIPLISEKGGACFACGLCPKGKADIRFAVKRR